MSRDFIANFQEWRLLLWTVPQPCQTRFANCSIDLSSWKCKSKFLYHDGKSSLKWLLTYPNSKVRLYIFSIAYRTKRYLLEFILGRGALHYSPHIQFISSKHIRIFSQLKMQHQYSSRIQLPKFKPRIRISSLNQ